MSVRAKFKVGSYSTSIQGQGENEREVRTVHLNPVYDADKTSENGKFYAYTPGGHIELGTINPEAWNQFELGKEYYVDFTPAE